MKNVFKKTVMALSVAALPLVGNGVAKAQQSKTTPKDRMSKTWVNVDPTRTKPTADFTENAKGVTGDETENDNELGPFGRARAFSADSLGMGVYVSQGLDNASASKQMIIDNVEAYLESKGFDNVEVHVEQTTDNTTRYGFMIGGDLSVGDLDLNEVQKNIANILTLYLETKLEKKKLANKTASLDY